MIGGGQNIREKLVYRYLTEDVNFGSFRDLIKLKHGKLKDLFHSFDLSLQPSKLNEFSKTYHNLIFGIIWKTLIALKKFSKICPIPLIHKKFLA